MKKDIQYLLEENNSLDKGIYINTDVEAYVDKILDRAKVISIYENNKISGFIAYYKNDADNKVAYLTMLLVDIDEQNQGLGSFLLTSSILDLQNLGFVKYRLEVLKTNFKALHFYSKHDFNLYEERSFTYILERKL